MEDLKAADGAPYPGQNEVLEGNELCSEGICNLEV